MAAVTDYPKLSGLTEIYSLQFWRPEVQGQDASMAMLSEGKQRKPFLRAFLLVPASPLASDT